MDVQESIQDPSFYQMTNAYDVKQLWASFFFTNTQGNCILLC